MLVNKEIQKQLYSELSSLTKNKKIWEENIDYVGSLLTNQSSKIIAKSLWMLGEMGLQYPNKTKFYINKIASFLDSPYDLLRERSLITFVRKAHIDIVLLFMFLIVELKNNL